MENQQPIWQRHLLLILGIALPFALMAFVVGYQIIVTNNVAPPRYAAVYTVPEGQYDRQLGTFESFVQNGKLVVNFTPYQFGSKEGRKESPDATLNVYVLRDASKEPEIFQLHPPKDIEKKTTLTLPAALQVPLINYQIAPDGYRYSDGYENYTGIMQELLIGRSRSRQAHIIIKNGKTIPLLPDQDRWINLTFIGWIAEPVRP